MGKRMTRPQAQKDTAKARELFEARRHLAAMAQAPRNRARYSRNDYRNAAQRGNWEV